MAAVIGTDVEQSKHAVKRNRWDVEDYTTAKDTVSTIEPAEKALAKAAWTGPRLMSDVYTSLHRANPQLIGQPWCLGATKAGQPRHPLYLPADAPLTVWTAP